jgi:hypothetical protein
MVMPEMIEPYLTQPYMTEPRLEFQPAEPSGESTPDEGQSADGAPLGLAGDDADPTEEGGSPDADNGTAPSDRDFFKRPYI